MYTIIMNNNKALTTSKRIALYEGDNLADKIRFLFHQTYKDVSLADCVVTLKYTDATGQEQAEILVKEDDLYKNRLSYKYPVDSKFTRFYGDILYYISFSMFDEDKNTEDVLFHTESHMITINPRPDSVNPGEVIPEDSASKILKEVYDLEDRVEELEENVVKYTNQVLSSEQQKQARENIGAISIDDIPDVEIPEQVQSDWNQNNEISADYIKNRTHYTYKEKIIDEVVFDEDVKYSNYNGLATYTFPMQLQIENGTECLIQFNDIPLVVTVGNEIILNNDDYDKIGNSVLLNNTGISVMYYRSGTGTGIEYNSNYSHLKISTLTIADVVVPLEDKFIPDTIVRFEVEEILELPDVSMIVNDDKNGNITVDTLGLEIINDNGNISITSGHMKITDDANGNVIIEV